jgi:hypothetical protein
MPRFKIQDFDYLEKSPTAPATLRNKLSEMLVCSTNARAKVELVNPETGEYKVVLHGTIDKDESKFDDWSW